MSIYSTVLTLEPVRECGYHPGDGEAGGYVDVATAISWYGGDGIRLSVIEPTETTLPAGWTGHLEAECIINREQIVSLRDALTAYLDQTERPDFGSTAGGNDDR